MPPRQKDVYRLIKQPIVTGDGVGTITPQQGQQIDTRDDLMVLARPMPMHQFDLVGIRLIERAIVGNQQTSLAVDMLLGLVLERRGIWFRALQ
jgi:hypothetical protein